MSVSQVRQLKQRPIMVAAQYRSAIRMVKEAEKNVRWCIESGASSSELSSARTKLTAADVHLDQIISKATLVERAEMLFPWRPH